MYSIQYGFEKCQRQNIKKFFFVQIVSFFFIAQNLSVAFLQLFSKFYCVSAFQIDKHNKLKVTRCDMNFYRFILSAELMFKAINQVQAFIAQFRGFKYRVG
jgi:hypothetical protein